MIVIESRLKEIFGTLPAVQIPDSQGNPVNHSIKFDWGTPEDLAIYLKQEAAPYPLIWLETGFIETYNVSKDEVTADLSLKIATSALKSSLLNQERIGTTFDLVLFPVLELVRQALERSSTVIVESQDWEITKFYNWSTSQQLETTQIWDALRCDISVTVNSDCLKPIVYG